jgi:hypothetical protein
VRDREGSFGLGFALGVCLGFALAGSALFVTDRSGKSFSAVLWSQEAAGWAQAIGTVLAVVAAGAIAAWQLRRSADLERVRNEREEFAARALLSAGLDEIASNARDNIKEIDKVSAVVRAGAPTAIPLLYTSPRAHELVGACIKFANAEAASGLASLLAFLQICEARLRAFATEAQDGDSAGFVLEARLRDCAEVYERASAYFEYARAIPTDAPKADELARALRVAGLNEADYPDLWQQLLPAEAGAPPRK